MSVCFITGKQCTIIYNEADYVVVHGLKLKVKRKLTPNPCLQAQHTKALCGQLLPTLAHSWNWKCSGHIHHTSEQRLQYMLLLPMRTASKSWLQDDKPKGRKQQPPQSTQYTLPSSFPASKPSLAAVCCAALASANSRQHAAIDLELLVGARWRQQQRC
jgi:hypothetical protein